MVTGSGDASLEHVFTINHRPVIKGEPDAGPDPEQSVALLLRDLRGSPDGLSTSEAERRLLQYGPNELRRRRGLRWPAELVEQLTHPACAAALGCCSPVVRGRQRRSCERSASSAGTGWLHSPRPSRGRIAEPGHPDRRPLYVDDTPMGVWQSGVGASSTSSVDHAPRQRIRQSGGVLSTQPGRVSAPDD